MYKKVKRVVYGATLADSSKYVVQEIDTDPKKLAEISNANVEIVPNVERELAVQVLKNWNKKNGKLSYKL